MNEDNNSNANTLTETEIKLRDAAIQFQLAVDHIDDEDYFRACINSFISFARSVTMLMEKESSKNSELLSWYKKHTDEFAKDPLMRFFNEQRVLTVHLGNVRPKAQSVPLRHRMSPGDSNEEPMMSIWVFDNVQEYLPDETGNVFRLCEQYLKRLTRLVQEWRYLRAVTEAPREVIEELQGQGMRLRGQIVRMRGELDQAKLSLELINDILKSKGDHSQDSFVTDLVRRIDMLVYPEKYLNSARVEPRGTIAFNDTGSLLINTIVVSPTEADGKGAEGVYATIRNDYARDENAKPIFNRVFGFRMWGVDLKGPLPSETAGFGSASDAEEAALRVYKLLRY